MQSREAMHTCTVIDHQSHKQLNDA